MSRPVITPEMLGRRSFPRVSGHSVQLRTDRAVSGPCYAFTCSCNHDDPGWWTEDQRLSAIYHHLGQYADLSQLY